MKYSIDELIEKFQREEFGDDYDMIRKKLDELPDPAFVDMNSDDIELIKRSNVATYKAEIQALLYEMEQRPDDSNLKYVLEDLLLGLKMNL